jgi:DNA-binding IclR family transcriptional regulator
VSKSYTRIAAVAKTAQILKFLAEQKEPISGAEVAKAINMPVGTVMSHLATLQDEGFVKGIGDRFEVGMGAALLWAKVKSNLEGQRDRIGRDLKEIKAEGAE